MVDFFCLNLQFYSNTIHLYKELQKYTVFGNEVGQLRNLSLANAFSESSCVKVIGKGIPSTLFLKYNFHCYMSV